jgi:hypothetical protein
VLRLLIEPRERERCPSDRLSPSRFDRSLAKPAPALTDRHPARSLPTARLASFGLTPGGAVCGLGRSLSQMGRARAQSGVGPELYDVIVSPSTAVRHPGEGDPAYVPKPD